MNYVTVTTCEMLSYVTNDIYVGCLQSILQVAHRVLLGIRPMFEEVHRVQK